MDLYVIYCKIKIMRILEEAFICSKVLTLDLPEKQRSGYDVLFLCEVKISSLFDYLAVMH